MFLSQTADWFGVCWWGESGQFWVNILMWEQSRPVRKPFQLGCNTSHFHLHFCTRLKIDLLCKQLFCAYCAVCDETKWLEIQKYKMCKKFGQVKHSCSWHNIFSIRLKWLLISFSSSCRLFFFIHHIYYNNNSTESINKVLLRRDWNVWMKYRQNASIYILFHLNYTQKLKNSHTPFRSYFVFQLFVC